MQIVNKGVKRKKAGGRWQDYCGGEESKREGLLPYSQDFFWVERADGGSSGRAAAAAAVSRGDEGWYDGAYRCLSLFDSGSG